MLLSWLTSILRSKLSCKLMQALRVWEHVFCKKKNQWYFESKALTEAQQGYIAIELGEVSAFTVCKPLHIGNCSVAPRGYFMQKYQASYTKVTKNLDKNFPIPFSLCDIYQDWPTNLQIACPIQVVKRTLLSSPSSMPTRSEINCVPEATAYNKLELLHKKMMSLCCSSIPSHKDGKVISKNFPVLYSLIGHLERN